MSSIVNEMIAEKLDQVILLLQAQQSPVISEEKWTALQRELEAIRQAQAGQQLQAKSAIQKSEFHTAIANLEQALHKIDARTTISHTHHLHRGIWVSAGLLIVSILMAWQCLDQKRIANQFRDNDIKYRYIKIFAPLTIRRFCHRADSLYAAGEDDFANRVVAAEKRLVAFADSIRLAGEKKRSIRLKRQ